MSIQLGHGTRERLEAPADAVRSNAVARQALAGQPLAVPTQRPGSTQEHIGRPVVRSAGSAARTTRDRLSRDVPTRDVSTRDASTGADRPRAAVRTLTSPADFRLEAPFLRPQNITPQVLPRMLFWAIAAAIFCPPVGAVLAIVTMAEVGAGRGRTAATLTLALAVSVGLFVPLGLTWQFA